MGIYNKRGNEHHNKELPQYNILRESSSPLPLFLHHILPRGLRTLGGERSAGTGALGFQGGRAGLQLTQLYQAVHLPKAAAGVVSTLGRQVLGFGIHILHHHLGAVLVRAPPGLGAAELGNKAVKGECLVVLGFDGQERRTSAVAPGTPVLRSLVEARAAGRLAEGIQGLSEWGRD